MNVFRALGIGVVLSPLSAGMGEAQVVVSANDSKATLIDGVNTLGPESAARHRHDHRSLGVPAEGHRRGPRAQLGRRPAADRRDRAG